MANNIYIKERFDMRQAIIDYMNDMETFQYSYENDYDLDQLHSLEVLARRISKINPPQIEPQNGVVSEDTVRQCFLLSLRALKNKKILSYFEDMLKRTTIVRDRSLESDDGRTDYGNPLEDGRNSYLIYLPEGKLTLKQQITFSHEEGHIPELEIIRDSFLEYQEVLPIFFEYLLELLKYGPNNAKDYFIRDRLSVDVKHAKFMRSYYKDCDSGMEILRLFSKQELVDSYKYLESTELVLHLIDIMNKDTKKVSSEIESVLDGKSFIDVAQDLSIDTCGCRKLLKEYQGYEKRHKHE